MQKKCFVTAINCMDGRVQLPVITWMKKEYNVEYVDMITEPGPIKILAEGQPTTHVQAIKDRTEISVQKHGSSVIAVVGHYDCAGNPVGYETQANQIKKAIHLINSWGFTVQIIGLWVDEQWTVHQLPYH